MNSKIKFRIGPIAIFILVALGFVADIIGLIPLAKDITASIFWIGASIYFWAKGMGLFNGRKLAAVAISWVSSLIPIIQELPVEVVAGIIAVILITRVEDKTGVSVIKPLSEGKKIASVRNTLSFNSGGRREGEGAQKTDRNQNLAPYYGDGVGKPHEA